MRVREVVRLLRAALWVWRQPLLVVATFATGLLIAASAAVAPFYVSSVRSGALADEVGGYCPWEAGHRAVTAQLAGPITGDYRGSYLTPHAGSPGGGDEHDFVLPASEELRRRITTLDQRLAPVPHLGPRELSWLGPTVPIRHGGARALRGATLLLRQGQASHVDVLDRAGGSGVWLPDTLAREIGAGAGDTVVLGASASSARVRVAAVYRDLAAEPRAPFWCSLAGDIWAPSIFAQQPPPVVLVPDVATLQVVSRELGSPSFTTYYERTLVLPFTVGTARRMTVSLAAATEPLEQFHAPPSVQLLDTKRIEVVRPDLSGQADRAVAVARAVGPPVSGIAAGGSAAALLLAAAVGFLWVDRRRREVELLHARGVSRSGLALQSVVELAAPFAAGCGVAWFVARFAVLRLGPGAVVDPGTGSAALSRAGVAALIGLTVIGGAVGLGNRRAATGALRRRLTLIPWELLLGAAAWALLASTQREGASTDQYGLALLRVSDLEFVLLVLGAGAIAGSRVLAIAIVAARRPAVGWTPAAFLAVRRLGASLGAVVAVAVTVAVPVGVFVAAHVTTATLSYTTSAKARLFVGADSEFELFGHAAEPPAALRSRATIVTRVEDASVSGQSVQVLGVDPATFANGAFWDQRFADIRLDDLLQRIQPVAGRPLPVIDVGLPASFSSLHLPGTSSAGSVNGTDVPVSVVSTVAAFPGRKNTPLVVVDRAALLRFAVHAGDELWVRGNPATAATAVSAAGLRVRWSTTAESVSQEPDLISVTWTFGFLQGLALLTGIVGVGGLLLYLNARQRRSLLAYVFARRMGLSSAAHVRSVFAETSTTLAWSAIVGGAVATWAAALVVDRLDPDPYVPPPPLLTLPAGIYVVCGAAVVVVCIASAVVVQVTSRHSNAAELLRG